MIDPSTAERIATTAHAGQTDKAGVAYIHHPRAVAALAASAGADPEVVAVAWLHDVVEDTAVTVDELRTAGLSDRQAAALDALTHRPDEPRADYIARIAANADAAAVKRADIGHNAGRIASLDDATTRDRLTEKYARDLAQLDAPRRH